MWAFLDRKSVGPAFRQNSMNSAFQNCLYNTLGHCFRVGYNNTAKAYVDNLFADRVRFLDETEKAIGRGPFPGANFRIIKKPIT